MFDIYESIVMDERYSKSKELREQFAAWCMLHQVTEVNNELKLNYLDEILGGEGDLVERILIYGENKTELVKFYALNMESIDTIEKHYELNLALEAKFDSTWDVIKLSKFLGVNIEKEQKVTIHKSYFLRNEVRFYYFKTSGLLIVADITLEEKKEVKEDYLNFFKALSDEKRFLIITELSKGDRTASELSKVGEITLSTINHHIRYLIEAGIVALRIDTNAGRGGIYTLNKNHMAYLIKGFTKDIIKI